MTEGTDKDFISECYGVLEECKTRMDLVHLRTLVKMFPNLKGSKELLAEIDAKLAPFRNNKR